MKNTWKRLRAVSVVCCAIWLSACGSARQQIVPLNLNHDIGNAELAELLLASDDGDCYQTFGAQKTWLVESHCESGRLKPGIYIADSRGVTHFNWYDVSFAEWQRDEGCAEADSCFYQATIDGNGRIVSLAYQFRINLSEGFFKLDSSGSELRVLEKKIEDSPS